MRQKRLYGLFEKRGFRWHRLGQFAYTLERARMHWQNDLLAPSLGLATAYPVRGIRSLRPIPTVELDATGDNVPFAGEVRP